MQEKHINTVLISGVTTENCVRVTAIDSVKRGFKTILLKDCVGTNKELAEKQQSVFNELEENGIILLNSISLA